MQKKDIFSLKSVLLRSLLSTIRIWDLLRDLLAFVMVKIILSIAYEEQA
jgi:hypothetical protein